MLYSRWSRYMQWSQFIASQQRERQTTVRRPQFNFQMTESCQIEPRRHCGGRWSPWGRATQTQNWSQEAEHHFPAVRQRRQPKKDLDFQAKFKGFGLSEEVLRNAKKNFKLHLYSASFFFFSYNHILVSPMRRLSRFRLKPVTVSVKHWLDHLFFVLLFFCFFF